MPNDPLKFWNIAITLLFLEIFVFSAKHVDTMEERKKILHICNLKIDLTLVRFLSCRHYLIANMKRKLTR